MFRLALRPQAESPKQLPKEEVPSSVVKAGWQQDVDHSGRWAAQRQDSHCEGRLG